MTADTFNTEVVALTEKLFRYAYRYLNDTDEAKDAVQEVFVKLWNQRKQLSEINNLEAFAIRVTRNHCLDQIKGKRTISLDAYDGYSSRISDSGDPQDQLQRTESVDLLKKIIDQLPEPQRSVIYMRDVEGYEPAEICSSLDMNEGNFRVILSRTRKRVREAFQKEYSHGDSRRKSIVAEVL